MSAKLSTHQKRCEQEANRRSGLTQWIIAPLLRGLPSSSSAKKQFFHAAIIRAESFTSAPNALRLPPVHAKNLVQRIYAHNLQINNTIYSKISEMTACWFCDDQHWIYVERQPSKTFDFGSRRPTNPVFCPSLARTVHASNVLTAFLLPA